MANTSRGCGRGSAHRDKDVAPANPSQPAPVKLPPIYWDKQHSAHTDHLVEWCQQNPSARLQLFSDSTQGAKEEGHHKEQARQTKNTYYVQLAQAIFAEDENPEFRAYSKSAPATFSAVIQRRLSSLRKKYNKINKELGQTGAGRTYEELVAEPRSRNIVESALRAFPWWRDLHGWWRTNPAYNTVYSMADGGQNHAAVALAIFQHKGKFPAGKSSAPKELEEGEVMEEEDVHEDGGTGSLIPGRVGMTPNQQDLDVPHNKDAHEESMESGHLFPDRHDSKMLELPAEQPSIPSTHPCQPSPP
ncbi:hypothetical protein PAXRUDRAFT_20867 [Paxillus rubicundulus Ve08.2h10]|uniref:Uncharacterized protein n=1 Tax=Paxillus rubicundulus Ve08.2h10 TaxID=930991 RepID=A0A0D0CD44_9AGAM|nr:hypothetical protein PAXRUDRAFT_20867 [Paxillus rubicundulus Ve08.2h10]